MIYIKNYARLIAENECIFPVTRVQSYKTTGNHTMCSWSIIVDMTNKLCEGYE